MAQAREERIVEIIVNGQKATASIKEMRLATRELESQINKLTPGTQEFIDKTKQLQEVKSRLQSVQDQVKGVDREMKNAQASTFSFKTAFAAAFSVTAIIEAGKAVFDFGKESLEAFNSADQAAAQLQATLDSTKNAAGLTREELEKLAGDRMKVTLFDDDATIQAESLLLTFTQIKKGVFEEAIPAIQDLATKMAGDGPADLKGASIQVGKALNDPIKGITALSRVGVSFTESQKDLIKQLVKTGDVAGAQKIILKELQTEFGGSAEAAAKAGTGGLTQFNNKIGNIKESIGSFINEGLQVAVKFLNSFIDNIQPVSDAFDSILTPVKAVFTNIMALIRQLGLVGPSFDAGKFAADAFAFVIKAAGFSLRVLAEGAGYVVKGLQYLVAGFQGTITAATSFFNGIKQTALQTLGSVGDIITGIFTLDPEKIKAGFANAKKNVTAFGSDIGNSFTTAFNASLAKTELPTIGGKASSKGSATPAQADLSGNEEGETEADKKTREKAEKKAAAALKHKEKEHETLLKELEAYEKKQEKLREDFADKSVAADLAMEDLRAQLTDKKGDDKLAKIDSAYQKQKAVIAKNQAETLANEAIGEEEKLALMDKYRQQADLAEDVYREKKKEAELQRQLTELEEKTAQDELNAEIKAEQDALALDQENLYAADKFARTMATEQERQDALYEIQKAALERRYALLLENNGKETVESLKVKSELLRLEKAHADEKLDNEKRSAEMKRKIINQGVGYAKDALDIGIQFLSQDEQARKKNAGLIKAFSIGKILADLYTEIAGYFSTPQSTFSFGTAGAIQSGIATARAYLAIRQVTSQQFAEGGSTNVSGKQIRMFLQDGVWQAARPAGSFAQGGSVGSAHYGVIGERGPEWVMPNWMLESPQGANIAGYLEAVRKQGYFAQGGPTQPAAFSVPSPSTNNAPDYNQLISLVTVLVSQSETLIAEVRSYPQTLKVINMVSETEDGIKLLNQVRDDSTIS